MICLRDGKIPAIFVMEGEIFQRIARALEEYDVYNRLSGGEE
jgi:hypothetical protein